MSKLHTSSLRTAHVRYTRACRQFGTAVPGSCESRVRLRIVNERRSKLQRLLRTTHQWLYMKGATNVKPHMTYLVYDTPTRVEHFLYKTEAVEHLRKCDGIGRNEARRIVNNHDALARLTSRSVVSIAGWEHGR